MSGGLSDTGRIATLCTENEVRRGGRVRQYIQNFDPVAHAAAPGNGNAKHVLLTFVVKFVVVFERPAALWLPDRPSGEATGDFGHVFLGIAAVNAQRVQLHQFAAVVFVQALLPPLHRIRSGRLPVIQIKQHGGTLGGGFEQILEMSQHVRADHIALVGRHHVAVRTFVQVDVEVVEPEIGEHLFQLAVTVNGAKHLAVHQILIDYLNRAIENLNAAAQIRRRGAEEPLPRSIRHRIQYIELLVRGQRLEQRQLFRRLALCQNLFLLVVHLPPVGQRRRVELGIVVLARFVGVFLPLDTRDHFLDGIASLPVVGKAQPPVQHQLHHLLSGIVLVMLFAC